MSQPTTAHRPDIDGLRAVAVLPVIGHHAGLPGVPGGFLGVDVFFVISGFLITGILLADLQRGQFSIARFYERRARRILPALVLTLLASVPLALALMLPGQLIGFGESLISVVLFLSNLHFWRSVNYFAEAAELQPLLHTWSLAVEEQFYVLFPLLLLALWRLARGGLIGVLGLLMLAGFGVSVWASHAMPVANFYWLPTRAWELLAGALCAVLAPRVAALGGGGLRSVLAALGLAMVVGAMMAFDRTMALPGALTLVPVAGTALVILFSRAGQGLAGRLLAWRLMVGIGLVSYSAYLFHQPLYAFARLGLGDGATPAILALLGLLALGFAALSWRFVEQPFRRAGGGPLPTRASVFAAGLVASLAVAMIGAGLIATRGLAHRYEPSDLELALFDRQEAGAYVRGRFNAARLQPFSEDGRLRFLVIGDSFAQDFVNVLAEGGFSQGLSLSTHHVSKQCGNLYQTPELAQNVAASDAALCESEGGLERAELLPLIRDADIIVLASDWQPWQLAHVAATAERLAALSSAEVFVLGRKDFGTVNLRDLIATDAASRPALRNPTRPEQFEADGILRATLGDRLIDIQAAICDESLRCPLFTPEGALISYDGGHLTRAGAAWVAGRLADHLPTRLTASPSPP